MNQALERAQYFIEEEEFKIGIMKKSQQVEQQCKSVESRLADFRAKTDRFRTEKYVLPQDSYCVMITELEALAGVIDESFKVIGYLIFNDPDQKEHHEENQAKVDKFKDTLLDLRLTLIGALEKTPGDTDMKDSVTNVLPKLPRSDTDRKDSLPNFLPQVSCPNISQHLRPGCHFWVRNGEQCTT